MKGSTYDRMSGSLRGAQALPKPTWLFIARAERVAMISSEASSAGISRYENPLVIALEKEEYHDKQTRYAVSSSGTPDER